MRRSQGTNDQFGALNHITNETILRAAKSEIQLGRAINLNLLLDDPFPPLNPSRRPLVRQLRCVDSISADNEMPDTLDSVVRRLQR